MDMKDTQTTSTGVKPPFEFWKQTKSGRWYYDEEAAEDKHLMAFLARRKAQREAAKTEK